MGLQKISCFGQETQGSLDKTESPMPLTPNGMSLGLLNTQLPGGVSQDTFKVPGAKFSSKLWWALSVLSQRIGGGGRSPTCDFLNPHLCLALSEDGLHCC